MPRQVEGVGPDDLARVRDVERHLLGACLWSDLHGSDGFDEAAEVVGPDDFGTHAHRVVFAAMLEMRAAAHAFAREPFHVETATPMSSARLASITRRAVRRDGLKLLVVDYLGLMEPEDLKAPRVHQVGLLSRRMKQLARQCRIPILVLCQLNRESEGRTDGKPKLSDLRDSGEVEQDADVVLLMSRQKNQPQENCVWLIDVDVAKNRGGMTGEVTLAYRRQVVRFENAVA